MVGIICPPRVRIGLTDVPNIGGASGPLAPPVPASLGLTLSYPEPEGQGYGIIMKVTCLLHQQPFYCTALYWGYRLNNTRI